MVLGDGRSQAQVVATLMMANHKPVKLQQHDQHYVCHLDALVCRQHHQPDSSDNLVLLISIRLSEVLAIEDQYRLIPIVETSRI